MPNQHKRTPLSIRLPEAEEARLRAYAEENHMSIGEAVRLAVRELTGDEVPVPEDEGGHGQGDPGRGVGELVAGSSAPERGPGRSG